MKTRCTEGAQSDMLEGAGGYLFAKMEMGSVSVATAASSALHGAILLQGWK